MTDSTCKTTMQNKNILLPGVFTVNAEGKKVRFAKSNVVRRDGKLSFFDNQFDCLGNKNDEDNSDLFNFNEALEIAKKTGLFPLSKLEWEHLFKNNVAKNSKSEFIYSIAGKNCLVLKPDGFRGRVKNSYTAKEWKDAEASGLVALPCAGYRIDSSIYNIGINGYYWSSSPFEEYIIYAYYTYFYNKDAQVYINYRCDEKSVRLISIQ